MLTFAQRKASNEIRFELEALMHQLNYNGTIVAEVLSEHLVDILGQETALQLAERVVSVTAQKGRG